MASLYTCLCALYPIPMFINYLIAFVSVNAQYDDWTLHALPRLPQPTSYYPIGYHTASNTIWILGNRWDANSYQRVSFDYTKEDTFTEHSDMSEMAGGYGQMYAQIGGYLYFPVPPDGSHLNRFNMETGVLTTNVYDDNNDYISFDGDESCIVSFRDQYLAILGIDFIVQILDINSDVWLNSPPSLNVRRKWASCIELNDKMFIIGGADNKDTHLSTIEYLDVSIQAMSNIQSKSWTNNPHDLPQAVAGSRAVAVNDDIVVIGGQNGGTYLDTVYVIDPISGSVSLGGTLLRAVAYSGVVFAGNTIYSFGGEINGGSSWDGWQSNTLASTSTTTTSVPTTTDSTTTITTTAEPTTAVPTTAEPTTAVPTTGSPTTKPTISPLTIEPNDVIWDGTIINIILSITDSISINDVVNTVNDTLRECSIGENIVYPLEIEVISMKGTSSTVIIMVQISNEVDTDDINMKEIEDKLSFNIKYEYVITINGNQYDETENINDDMKDVGFLGLNPDLEIYILLGIGVISLCIILIISGSIYICIKNRPSKQMEMDSKKNPKKSVESNVDVDVIPQNEGPGNEITRQYDDEGVINSNDNNNRGSVSSQLWKQYVSSESIQNAIQTLGHIREAQNYGLAQGYLDTNITQGNTTRGHTDTAQGHTDTGDATVDRNDTNIHVYIDHHGSV